MKFYGTNSFKHSVRQNNDKFFAIFYVFYPTMDSYVGETHEYEQ